MVKRSWFDSAHHEVINHFLALRAGDVFKQV